MRSFLQITILCFLISLLGCDITDSNGSTDKSKQDKLAEVDLTLTSGQATTITANFTANSYYTLTVPGTRSSKDRSLAVTVTAPSGTQTVISYDLFFYAQESGEHTITFTWNGSSKISTKVTINTLQIPTSLYGTWYLTSEKEIEDGVVEYDTSFASIKESNYIIELTPSLCIEYKLESDTIYADTFPIEALGSELLYMSVQNGSLVYNESGSDGGSSWSFMETYKSYNGSLPPQEWVDKINGDDDDNDDDTPVTQVTTTMLKEQTATIPSMSTVQVSFSVTAGQVFSVETEHIDSWVTDLKDPSGNYVDYPFGAGHIAQSSGTYTALIENDGDASITTKIYVYKVEVPQNMQGAWYIAKEMESEDGDAYEAKYDSPDESPEINIFSQSTIEVLSAPSYRDQTPIGSYWGIGCPAYPELTTFFRGDTLVISDHEMWEGISYVYEVSLLPYDGGSTFPDGWSGRGQKRRVHKKRKRR